MVALIERGGLLLLERRRDTGQWNPPGGRVEIDESFEQALRKEVREETVLTIARFSLFGTFSDPSRIGAFADGMVMRLTALAYIVEVDDFSPLACSDEPLELGFFSRDSWPIWTSSRPAAARDAYLTRVAPVLD